MKRHGVSGAMIQKTGTKAQLAPSHKMGRKGGRKGSFKRVSK